MQIVHVIRDLELSSGGPSRSIPQLVLSINQATQGTDWSQHLVFGDRGQPNATVAAATNLKSHGIRSHSRLATFNALADCTSELHGCQPITILHVHGLWSPELHGVVRWARTKNIPYVVSPRGMLSQWCFNHKWLKKRIGWLFYQRQDLMKAAAIHATSDDEQNDVRRMGLNSPIFVIPNGMQVCEGIRKPNTSTQPRLAVCITRLHPVKGLDLLIEAWARSQLSNWKLVIAGPSEAGMRERLDSQIKSSQQQSSIELLDSVEGAKKAALLNEAELFVLPSYSENFGMAIAESLAHGIPVITTTGTPWSSIVSNRCGWFVTPEVQGLQQALVEATSCSAEKLVDMGRRGQALIANDYSWKAVASRMLDAYSSIVLKKGAE